MKGAICHTCSCSLVRLGIEIATAPVAAHNGIEYRFCCEGCAEAFRGDPARFAAEVADWVVCPSCLGEKPKALTVAVDHESSEVCLCRCPCCREEFEKLPHELLARLAA